MLPEDFPSSFLEYLSPRSTISPPNPSPLAAKLFDVEGVTSVFYGADFITVTKAGDTNWAHIKPEVFSLITQAVTSGETIVSVVENSGAEAGQEGEEDSLAYNEDDDEVTGMIKEILETRIRPAIQEDGGDIELRGFEDGIVMLKLRGACRTCDSSTVTLKNGIESMLMHYVSPFLIDPVVGHSLTHCRSRRSRVLSRLWTRRKLFRCMSLLGSRRSCASRRVLRRLPLALLTLRLDLEGEKSGGWDTTVQYSRILPSKRMIYK